MKPTKKQIEAINSLDTRHGQQCPKCKETGGQYLEIENPGEDKTQIYCCYCREYLFIEDYKRQ